MVEMRSRLAYRKSESGNPPPTAGAPELYPNPAYGSDIEALSTETERPKLGRTYGAWRQSSTLLHDGDDYHWETCSKTAGIMSLVFDFIDHNEIYAIRNPMDRVTIPASEEAHPEIRLLSPDEVFSLIERLPSPINIAVLLVAATGVRISECLGLRWRHVLWDENRISIEQVFRRGEILNRTKT
jgi:integrase